MNFVVGCKFQVKIVFNGMAGRSRLVRTTISLFFKSGRKSIKSTSKYDLQQLTEQLILIAFSNTFKVTVKKTNFYRDL